MQFGELIDNWSRHRAGLRGSRLLAYLGIAAALVLVAPFGTGDDPWLWRLGYWTMLIAVFDLALVHVALNGVRRVPWMQQLPYTVGLAVMPLVLAVPMTACVMALDLVFAWTMCPLSPGISGALGAKLARACTTPIDVSTGEMYGNVFAIGVLAGGLLLLCTGGIKAFARQVPQATQPGTRFMSRLPAYLGTDIRYIQMQDHYLRVVTRGGEALVLMPFRDALTELDGVEGLQVHRSWWVALGAIAQVVRDGRKTVAVMVDGAHVPVSDTYRAALRNRIGLA